MLHAKPRTTAQPGVRWWRGLLPAIAFLPLVAWWAADSVSDVIFSLLVPPIAAVGILALANVPLRVWRPRWALGAPELAIAYVFLSVANAMCAEWLWINQRYVAHFALFGDQSPWVQEHIVPHLPRWFYPDDAEALETFRRGGFGISHMVANLGVWARPIAAWTALFGALAGSMLFLNALMREQWTRRERLAFPIVQVPVLLTQPGSPAWRSGYLWGAFGVVFALDMLNGFNFLYPGLPSVNLRFWLAHISDALPWMLDRPYAALGWTPVGLFPYMAAIGLFMPTDLLFSLVFFFFARKGLQVAMDMYGYEQGVFGGGWLVPEPPYFSEQSWGAIFALFVAAVVASRGYLREVARHVRRGTAFSPGDVKPRTALVGMAACLGALAWIGHSVGLPVTLVVGYVGIYLVFSVVLTRMRAQIGSPIHEFAFLGPHQLLLDVGGSRALGEAATTRLYHLFFITNRIHRTDPMPYQLEGFKVGDGAGLRARTLLAVMAAAVILGLVAGQLAYILRGYVHGTTPAWNEPANAVRTITEQNNPTNMHAIAAILVGFTVVMLLDLVRFHVPGFALHPVGYALSMNFGIDYCWFGLLVALLVKAAVQRYWGLKGYEKLRLVGIGLILGEFAAETIWAVTGMVTETATYSISYYNDRAGWMK